MELEIVFLLAVASLATSFQDDELKCWLRLDNVYHPGLEKSESINNFKECALKCRENDFCRAFHVDDSSVPKCWYQRNKRLEVKHSDLKPKTSVVTYLYDSQCVNETKGVDLGCWTVTPRHQIKGLTKVNQPNLTECLNACVQSDQCSTVDWDVYTKPRCWIQTKNMEVSVKLLKPLLTVTNFIRKEKCPGDTKNDAVLVTSPDTRSQIAELKCWTKRKQTYHPSLENSVNINDTVECVKKCSEDDFCHAVDIDTGNVPNCRYQQKSTFVVKEDDLRPKNTSTNYVYDPTCGKITKDVDLSCWTVTPKFNIPDLTLTDKPTLAECLEACTDSDNCSVVDWDTETKPNCWIQTKSMEVSLEKLKPKSTVTNFMLNRDCFKLVHGLDLSFWKVSDLLEYPSPGLTPVNRTDLKSCLSFCKGEDVCSMLDFDQTKNPPCRVQTEEFEIERGKLVESKSNRNFFLKRTKYEKYLECVKSGFVKPERGITAD